MFTHAIVRKPANSMVRGLTSSDFGIPDIKNAKKQHHDYISALEKCGLKVTILEEDENYPDSVFIEDVALLTPFVAIVTNPGAESRRGEVKNFKDILAPFYKHIEEIKSPGCVEAGDIMMVGSHYYIGLSQRTNKHGARQLINILNRYEMDGSVVPLKKMLHLKTGLSYLENNNLLVMGEFIDHPEFERFNRVIIPDDEAYAANSVWINGKVIVPLGYPKTNELISALGYETILLDVSEFRKLDGGLSCLSLRF